MQILLCGSPSFGNLIGGRLIHVSASNRLQTINSRCDLWGGPSYTFSCEQFLELKNLCMIEAWASFVRHSGVSQEMFHSSLTNLLWSGFALLAVCFLFGLSVLGLLPSWLVGFLSWVCFSFALWVGFVGLGFLALLWPLGLLCFVWLWFFRFVAAEQLSVSSVHLIGSLSREGPPPQSITLLMQPHIYILSCRERD